MVGRKRLRGFSMLELAIVLAVSMIIAAVAIPSVLQGMSMIKLRSTAENVQSILYRSRLLAVRGNRFYTALVSSNVGGVTLTCVDLNDSRICNNNEPNAAYYANVSLVNAFPSTATLTCGPSPTSTGPCPAGYNGLNFTPQAPGVLPMFSSRGLPCVGPAANLNPAFPNICRSTPTAGFGPVGFLYVLQYGNNNQYAAVVVDPSGLVNVYTYSGPDANGNSIWNQQ